MLTAKRCFDLVFAVPGFVAMLPVLAGVAVAIRLDSQGPILFRQIRVGQNGRPFRVLKFRTMVPNAEAQGAKLTAGRDPRITRVGAVLRKAKLDELPQLINVIRGEMSLVGPRPEVPEYVRLYPAEIRSVVLSVPPGITDYASIEFRDENELLAGADDPAVVYVRDILPRKLQLNVEYVRHRSLTGDLLIILRTLLALAHART